MTADNPLLEPWDTPWGMPPFAAIEDAHFLPAYEEAMRLHAREIAAIADNPEPANFENSIEALERSGRALTRLDAAFSNLTAAETNEARQDIERRIAPLLAKHYLAIATNPKLFARVEAVFERAGALDLSPEQSRLLEKRHRSFIRAGAKLDEAGKARVTAIGARLAELQTAFSQNILSDEKSWALMLEGEADLDGLPNFVRQAAAQSAADRGQPGKFAITLARASIEPFLQFSRRRDLRETAYRAYISRGQMSGPTGNAPLISEILTLRTERAKLLGFKNYAEFRLDDVMAKTPVAVRTLLDEVWQPALAKARGEQTALERLAAAEGQNGPLAPWDWLYFTEKRRKSEFALDGAALKPYFQLENMIAAAFDTAGRLFGLAFHERHDVTVYHPDVRAFEVKDRDGRPIGLFLGDYFQRPNKRGNAWMSAFRAQERLDGAVLPIVVNVMNFAKGADGEPSLLSLDDARTLFHEFGHALHGLLSDVTYPSLAGTNVDRDFVELPSQLFENWLLRPETLSRFARSKTGEALPEALAAKVIAQRKFNQGFATVEYTASARVDLDLHEAELPASFDVNAFEARVRQAIGMPDAIALRHRPPHFLHVFAGEGYAAGYYTYLWAEVMEADAFRAFEEKGDIFDRETALRLRQSIYGSGGSMPPGEAFRAFRGRDPATAALMEKRGLK